MIDANFVLVRSTCTWYKVLVAWYVKWLYQMRYKKCLILFICTSHKLLIRHEKIMRQYETSTNEKYKLFLYLTVATIAKYTRRLILYFITVQYSCNNRLVIMPDFSGRTYIKMLYYNHTQSILFFKLFVYILCYYSKYMHVCTTLFN